MERTMTIKKFFAPASCLRQLRFRDVWQRLTVVLMLVMLTTVTAWAQETMTVTAEDVTVTYDGSEHYITVNVSVPESGATITYCETENGTYTSTNPTYTDAGVNTVYYKVTASGYADYSGSATVTISQKDLTVTANAKVIDLGSDAANDGVTYDGFVEGENQDTEGIFGTTELTYAYKTSVDGTGDDYSTTSPEGTYYIIPSGLTATNYNIIYVAGTLRVVHTATLFAANSTNLWATFCDTYERTLPEGCTAYTISSISGSTLTLSDALTTIPAYTPVLVKRESGELSQDIKPQYYADGTEPANYTGIVTSTDAGWTFYGNCSLDYVGPSAATFINADNVTSYVLRNGQFVMVNSNIGLKSHRCVLNVGSVLSAPVLTISTDVTEIKEVKGVNASLEVKDNSWYSLDGRKLNGMPTQKGVYVKNGKKYCL